ncbi:hypothetical protein A11A3_06430 [Alcanivorax hongdengensis A-11-3]|uniref:DUF7793 domain-containing protein n=1 Tax=Alcanivorax hongdengensis A-11-3 TaxID=1177179 RepID=L0WFA9_9GAMM|nr:hypothetical protein [Alcanivorax hongdengensis]EKF74847.1 hypothetical protein A11A3_06430 [Alcanivorax hongdengensis A-11-3]
MGPVNVWQDGAFTIVSIRHGTAIDIPVEQNILRQRMALFLKHKQRKQHVIYTGRIASLNMLAARFACSEEFASITQAKVLVIENVLNRTFMNMMLRLNKPAFPVMATASVEQAKRLLTESFSR